MRNTFGLMLMVSIVAGASAQDVADYTYFKDDGVFDPNVSVETANALVREGIASEDPVVLDLTIRALAGFAMHVVHGLPTPYGSLPERSFAAVPALKPVLIEHWREQHRRSGYNTLAAIQRGLGAAEGAKGFDEYTRERLGLTEDASQDDLFDAVLAGMPAWTMIPQTLCALYPGDGDVLEVLWEREGTDVSPGNANETLRMLNVGRFATPEANAFRIHALAAPSDRYEHSAAVTVAANGLALSRPLEAVPHLISAGLEHRSAREEILVVLAAYDDDALSPYASEVASLLGETHVVQAAGAVADAFSRLEAFSRRSTNAEPR